MNDKTWKDLAVWALVVVVSLVSWIGASHLTEPYHPKTIELLDERLAEERRWNEAKHDVSAADRRQIAQELAAMKAILLRIERKLD